ncbi:MULTISPECIES: hypothetical protein [Aquimarina]|uniref:hypothetical protein n=1 Tax=Aquimarina TaxID=290174 RepID=UPI000941D3ED|nr:MULTISPECIES: hypothetical protein [Aquimarina]
MDWLNNIKFAITSFTFVIVEDYVKVSDAIVPGIFGILFLIASFYTFRKYISYKKNNTSNEGEIANPIKNRVSGIIILGLMGIALVILSIYLIIYRPATKPRNKVDQVKEIFKPSTSASVPLVKVRVRKKR